MKLILSVLFFVKILGLSFSSELNYTNIEVSKDLLGNLDISAISCINNSICLVASDETNSLQVVSLDDNYLEVKNLISLGIFSKENDIEGLTNDGKFFYAVGSHGLSRKKDKYQPSRFQIFKLLLDAQGKLVNLKTKNLEQLLSKSELSRYFKKSIKNNGINIEGLAYDRGALYLGFRSPVINGKGQILSFSSDSFWNHNDSLSTLFPIELGQNRGIRSLEVRNGVFYTIAGPSDSAQTTNLTYKLCINQIGTQDIECEVVPNNKFKVEGFEILKDSSRLFFYDSQINGSPVLQN